MTDGGASLGNEGSGTVAQSDQVHGHGPEGSLPIPRQLPPAPRQFVNRKREVDKLDGLTAPSPLPCAPVVILTGMRGVGKSATSRYWAHTNCDRYKDGQLYVDFGELRHEGGAEVGDVLGSFLRALGLPEDSIPQTLAERIALFRSSTADKRMLLLLEDVDRAAQVQPLIPNAAGSVVLVTSRGRLEELVNDGAGLVRLSPLDDGSAQAILSQMVDEERVLAEPAAVEELLHMCAGLPIAVRICGARLASHEGRPVQWLVDELADENRRLERIVAGSERSVDAIFTDAYQALSVPAGVVYRRLGMHPGPNFTVTVAAAASGLPRDQAAEFLDEIVAAQLIEDANAGGCHRFHDLLRIHARNLARTDESEEEQEAALCRVVDFYVFAAQTMDRAIVPSRLRLADLSPPPFDVALSFRSPSEAFDWFEAERSNLLAVLRTAAARGWDAQVWHIGEALWQSYHNRKHYGEALEVYGLAATSAQRCGDLAAEARVRNQLARAYMDLGDHARAEAELASAGQLASGSGNRSLQASIVEFTGILNIDRERYPEAIAAFEHARATYQQLDDPRGIAIQEYHLGRALDLSGDHDEAVRSFLHAVDLIDADVDALTLGRVLLHLGDAYRALGDGKGATSALERALDIMQRHEAPFYAAMAQERLAEVKELDGDATAARQHLREALAIYAALGNPRAQEVTARMGEAPGGSP